jgi:hypothetical protein
MAAPVVDAEYLRQIDRARRALRALIASKGCAPIMLRLAYVPPSPVPPHPPPMCLCLLPFLPVLSARLAPGSRGASATGLLKSRDHTLPLAL